MRLGDVPLVKVLYEFHRSAFGSAFIQSCAKLMRSGQGWACGEAKKNETICLSGD